MDSRDKAVLLARQGYRVFRVDSQKHRPARTGWTETASADPERVRQDFTDALGESVEDNPAIATGADLLVVDVDVKGGKPGLLSLAELAAEGLPLDTRTVRTPSGGLHLYYRVDPSKEYRNRVGWREGVDVRGFNGFVFAPGALKGGGVYAVERDLPTAALPDSFYEDLARPLAVRIADNGAIPAAPDVDVDSDAIRARVADWLETEAPVSIEGDSGHDTLLDVAHGCMDRGVTPTVAAELMAGHWDFRCEPEWGDDVIAAQIASLVHSRKDRIGCAIAPRAPLGEVFEPIDGVVVVEANLAAAADDDEFSPGDLAGKEPPPRRWIVPDLIPARTVTLLSGDGGVGKSLLALQLACARAVKARWLGLDAEPGRTLYISAEDDKDEIHRRLAGIAQAERFDLAGMADLRIIDRAGKDAVMGMLSGASGKIVATKLWRRVEQRVAEWRPGLVIFDTSADVYAGNENVREQVRQFVGMLRGLAIKNECAVLLLTHPSNFGTSSGSGTSGSTAWNNSVRSRLYFRRPDSEEEKRKDPNLRILKTMKANYTGGVGDEMRLRWDAGRFIAVDGGVRSETDVDAIFMALLTSLAVQRRYVSKNDRAPNYAPKMFAAERPEVSRPQFEAAMRRLFTESRIAVGTCRTAERKTRECLVVAPGAPGAPGGS